jgi:hypothetical protein
MKIAVFKSVWTAYVLTQHDEPWSLLAELLMNHHPGDSKNDIMMFNLADFKTVEEGAEPGRRYHYIDGVKQTTYDIIPNTIRRCKANVKSISGIVLDVDDSMTIEQAEQHLQDIEYVLYTTFRHTKEQHKFRIVIPFSKPLLAEDIAGYEQDIRTKFPLVDGASFTMSQSFYFHSGNNGTYTRHNPGRIIDPYVEFTYTAPPVYEPRAIDYGDMTDELAGAYREAVIRSLLSCSGLRYASKTGRQGVLTLVSICKSIGLSFGDFDTICRQIAAQDSQLQDPGIRSSAWAGWAGDRIHREKRDAFIEQHNGMPVKIVRVKKEDPIADTRIISKKKFLLERMKK